MRVGLYGIYGTYNFGCEAIVRGAVKFIRARFDDCKIVYFSYSYEFDRKALSDLDITVVPVENTLSFTVRAINKAFRILHFERRLFTIPFREMMDQIDIVFSIGGDIYTIPAYLRERKKYPYYNHLVDFCNAAISCGKKVILYGASVGPFGEYKRAVNYYVKNLRKYEKILCREMDAADYLKSLGLDNTAFFPDPAFTVRLEPEEEVEKRYIGVNFSPLSLNETNGSYGTEDVRAIASLMDRLIEESNESLLFIPHVISDNPNDNDCLFLKEISSKMVHMDKVSFADYSGGFLGIKRQLRECKIVISARMHCAINAVCENVPTIFLSYSQKSVGMCKYVYGNENWVIQLGRIHSDLIGRTRELLKNHDAISHLLTERNQEIQDFIAHSTDSFQIGDED